MRAMGSEVNASEILVSNCALISNKVHFFIQISHIEEILKDIGTDVDENDDKENEGEENWEDYETDSENEVNEMDEG